MKLFSLPLAEYLDCHACGKPTRIDILDSKDDGTGNYTTLECQLCYGPGWEPMRYDWLEITDPPHQKEPKTCRH